jgi:hypothetical protein
LALRYLLETPYARKLSRLRLLRNYTIDEPQRLIDCARPLRIGKFFPAACNTGPFRETTSRRPGESDWIPILRGPISALVPAFACFS